MKYTINDRKRIYDEFEKWVKDSWIYNVPNSLFANSLDRRKSKGFSAYATQKDALDDILDDKKAMLKAFIAYSLNGGHEGSKKWIVNNKRISNVFIENNKGKEKNRIVIFYDIDEYKKHDFDVKGESEEIERIFWATSENELKKYGFATSLITYWREHVLDLLNKNLNVEDRFIIEFAFISKDDHSDEVSREGQKYKVWGLPSIFSNTQYQPFVDHKENVVFKIQNDMSSGSKFIDIKGNKKVTGKSDRVIVAPVSVVALANFVKEVNTKFGTIDSLFTLNVRDRKATTGKVSQAIIRSLQETPEDFLMLNNGITAIVDKISIHNDEYNTTIEFKNIKIINGQQTTNTIYQYLKNIEILPKKLENAYVMLKAYEVDKNESSQRLFNDISNASNQQNAIKAKDLMSTREFNSILSEELVNLGIYYHYRDGKSDHSSQFKGMPKTTLSDLVKMHYIFMTGEVWSRANVGSVFDSLTGLVDNREGSQKSKYASLFNNIENKQLAYDLRDIATFQLYFKNLSDELGKEKQALDLLIYIALILNKYGTNYRTIDIKEFAQLCENYAGQNDRNNYYKSKKSMVFLLSKLFKHYNLENTPEAKANEFLLKDE